MGDPRLENLAKILVNYSTEVKPGDWVVVRSSTLALPLANEVVRHVLREGAHINVMIDDDQITEITLAESTDAQLEWISPMETLLIDNIDVLIRLDASNNTHALSAIDPAKQRLQRQSRREMMQTYMQRAADGELRWLITNFPCNAFAQDADMSLSDYEDFVFAATFADQPDPVQSWQEIYDMQQHKIDWLKGKKEVKLRSPNCDLTLSIEGRTFINSAGRNNMPSGEIFTGPVEDSANGWVKFTYPAVSQGREVEGVELELKDGKVVNASATKNEKLLLTMLDSDPGARYLGEFAIGTNYGIKKFTKNILYDEKIGGSFHMALGAGYPETGSVNKSSIHWDMICDIQKESEILVDDKLFYKDGEFVI